MNAIRIIFAVSEFSGYYLITIFRPFGTTKSQKFDGYYHK